MEDEPVTVLDHIDNITVPGKMFDEPANEYWALCCLWHGLEFLNHQAAKCDQVARENLGFKDGITFMTGGTMPGVEGVPKTLLTCSFQWYAVSACQYVWLVGAIAHRFDNARPLPRDYAMRIIPEVQAFRDKVGAHYSWGTQNIRDNAAERFASILPPLMFSERGFQVGAFQVAVRQKGVVSNSEVLKPWGICEVHARLRSRYWPSGEGTL